MTYQYIHKGDPMKCAISMSAHPHAAFMPVTITPFTPNTPIIVRLTLRGLRQSDEEHLAPGVVLHLEGAHCGHTTDELHRHPPQHWSS